MLPLRPIVTVIAALPLLAGKPQDMVKRLKKDLTYFASPELKGRGNGQEGLEKAAQYAAETFRKLGLKTEIQRFPYTLRMDREKAELSLGGRPLVLGKDADFAGNSGSGVLKDAPLVFVGYGLNHGGYKDLEGVDLRGKVAVLGAMPPATMKVLANLDRRQAFQGRMQALEQAGAVGIILVAQDQAGQRMMGGRGQGGKIPVMTMSPSLLPGVEDGFKQIASTERPASRVLPGLTLSAEVKLKPVVAQVPNVLALVPGTDKKLKAEHLVVGAHLDHLGSRKGADGQETIFFGADDNGTGSVAVLEMGRQLLKSRPKRSVLLMLYGGEEIGLVGSRHWVNNPTVPLESVKFMVNFDMIGRLEKGSSFTYAVSGLAKDRLEVFPKRTVQGVTIQASYSAGGGGGSDHASFLGKRIPATCMITGLHADYHKATDTLDKINFEGMAAITEYAADLVKDLSARPVLPGFEARPNLGFQGGQERGYAVGRINPGSTAEALGLKEGDFITGLDRARIRNATDFNQAMENLKVGQEVTVKWTREGKPMEGKAKLKEQ